MVIKDIWLGIVNEDKALSARLLDKEVGMVKLVCHVRVLASSVCSSTYFSHLLGLVWREGSYGNWTPSVPAISATSSLVTR